MNTNQQRAKLTRELYIKNGKCQATKNDPLHLKGCILYWAEGDKKSNAFAFTNCDVEAHRLMVLFLRQFFPEQSKRLKARIAFYPGGNSYEEIKSFWSKELDIHFFGKPTDRSKYYKTPITNKYPNGVLQLQLGSTEVMQNILGAINYYIGKDIYNADSFR